MGERGSEEGGAGGSGGDTGDDFELEVGGAVEEFEDEGGHAVDADIAGGQEANGSSLGCEGDGFFRAVALLGEGERMDGCGKTECLETLEIERVGDDVGGLSECLSRFWCEELWGTGAGGDEGKPAECFGQVHFAGVAGRVRAKSRSASRLMERSFDLIWLDWRVMARFGLVRTPQRSDFPRAFRRASSFTRTLNPKFWGSAWPMAAMSGAVKSRVVATWLENTSAKRLVRT